MHSINFSASIFSRDFVCIDEYSYLDWQQFSLFNTLRCRVLPYDAVRCRTLPYGMWTLSLKWMSSITALRWTGLKISPVSKQFVRVWRHAKQLPMHPSTIWLLHLVPRSYSGKVLKRLRPILDRIFSDTKTELEAFLTPSVTRGLIHSKWEKMYFRS